MFAKFNLRLTAANDGRPTTVFVLSFAQSNCDDLDADPHRLWRKHKEEIGKDYA
jgi:hypothetical protein